MLKLAYQGELEAFQTQVIEELFLWLVLLGTEFQQGSKVPRVILKWLLNSSIVYAGKILS